MTIVAVFLVVAAILILAAGAFMKAYWSGLATELGASTARALAGRRSRHRALRSALQTARAGAAPAKALGAISGVQGSDAIERVLSRVDRPPAVTALATAVSDDTGPLAGKVPIVVSVGRHAIPLLRSVRTDPQLKTAPTAFAVGASAGGPESGVEQASGDLWSQLNTAMEWAADTLSHGVGDFVAVLLDTPITGSWSDDADLDLPRLFEVIFRDRSRATWLSYNEPIDPTAWPEEIIVEFQAPVDDAIHVLAAAGLSPPHIRRRVSDQSVVMASVDVVALVLMLTSSIHSITGTGSPTNVAAVLPPYSAAITLALEPATQSGAGDVGRDLTAARNVEDLLLATGVRILTVGYERPSLVVNLSWPGKNWLGKSPLQFHSVSLPGSRLSVDSTDDAAMQWLLQAITSSDDQVAAAVLASHGRAWIEAASPQSAIEPIRRPWRCSPNTRERIFGPVT